MIKIGDKEQIHAVAAMVADNETLELEIPTTGVNLSFTVVPPAEPGDLGNLTWKTDGPLIKMTSTGVPKGRIPGVGGIDYIDLGQVGDRRFLLRVLQENASPSLTLVHLFFYLGGTNA